MQQISSNNFGVVIAFFLPGFIVLFGIAVQSESAADWLLGVNANQSATIGGFLFSTIAALILGLLCSTIRWLVVDTIHHRTGLKQPRRDFRCLQTNLDAYRMIEGNHYQFYQFYGNSLIALLFAYPGYRTANVDQEMVVADVIAVVVAIVLFLGSRDTLRKYYARVQAVLAQVSPIQLGSFLYREIACSMEFRER